MTARPSDPDRVALRPVWLSHHHAGEADRCTVIAGRHVCRRCLAMFAGFVPAFVLLLSPWRDHLQVGDVALVLGLTVLAGIEFVQVVRGRLEYRARRVLVLAPPTGAVLAWLGVTGFADGLGAVHVVFGLLGLGVLAVLVAHGSIVGSSRQPA